MKGKPLAVSMNLVSLLQKYDFHVTVEIDWISSYFLLLRKHEEHRLVLLQVLQVVIEILKQLPDISVLKETLRIVVEITNVSSFWSFHGIDL